VAACYAMHFLHNIAIRPNLELKTWPKQLLGSLPLDIALPAHILLGQYGFSNKENDKCVNDVVCYAHLLTHLLQHMTKAS
jgi:hypothetical protein